MALYINGRPVNPIVTFLASAVVIAGIIGLGILLLPLIGGLFVIALLIVAGIALYGAYCRWRYGDPFAQMQNKPKKCCVAAHDLKRSSLSSRRCKTNLTSRPERPVPASSA